MLMGHLSHNFRVIFFRRAESRHVVKWRIDRETLPITKKKKKKWWKYGRERKPHNREGLNFKRYFSFRYFKGIERYFDAKTQLRLDMSKIYTWNTFFVVTEFFVSFLGTLSNGLVIFTVLRNTHRLASPTYLIFSIAVSDILSCLIAVPFSIAGHFLEEWPFGMAGCRAHAFMIFLLALVSITHLTAISVEKYLTITKSLLKESYWDTKQVILVICASWVYSFGFSVAPLLGWSSYGMEGTNATCSIKWESSAPEDKAYLGIMFVACYFLPIVVIAFCYQKIHKVSKHVVNATSQMGDYAITMTKALLKKRRKSAMYFTAVIAAYLLSWTPYATASLIIVSGQKVHPIVLSACSVFAKTSFFLNPFMYVIFSRRFRRIMIQSIPTAKRNRLIRPVLTRMHSETASVLWKHPL